MSTAFEQSLPNVVLWRSHDTMPPGHFITLRSSVKHAWLRRGDIVLMMACGARARTKNVGIDAVLVVQHVARGGRRARAAVWSRPSTRREWFGCLKKYQMPHRLTPDELRTVRAYQPAELLPACLFRAATAPRCGARSCVAAPRLVAM